MAEFQRLLALLHKPSIRLIILMFGGGWWGPGQSIRLIILIFVSGWWRFGNNGAFSMTSLYEKLLVRNMFFHVMQYRFQRRWECVLFHLASHWMGVILTMNLIEKLKVVCISWCYMCKEAGEVVDHLLLYCMIWDRGRICLAGLTLQGECKKLWKSLCLVGRAGGGYDEGLRTWFNLC